MIQIFTATGCKIPYEVPEYCVPVEAGSYFRKDHLEGYQRDDKGENISEQNHEYCELSVLYWGWKNATADIKGLCHYRRFFHKSDKVSVFQNEYVYGKDLVRKSPTAQQIESMLEHSDIILPIPYHPYPRTIEQDLWLYVYPRDVRIMERILRDEYPLYYKTYCEIKKRYRIPYCNMMIARAEVYDAYCAWLFPLLKRIGHKTNLTHYDAMHKRVYGYLSEVLLSVWVETNGLRASYLNLAQVWDLWKKPVGTPNLVRIGGIIHMLESMPITAELYHFYSKTRYPYIYSGYLAVRETVEKSKQV